MARTSLFSRQQAGGQFAIEDASRSTGNRFYVDSGSATKDDSVGAGQNPDSPFATIDFAIGQCTADNGDIIYPMPGHVDTVIAAAGIDLDVAGISIIGLGVGASQPIINFTTATGADIDVDAANVYIQNVAFDFTGIDAIVAAIDVNSADFKMKGCRYIMSDSGGQAVLGILTDANADRMTIEDCIFEGSTDAGPAACIRLVGCDRAIIRNCKMYGDYSVGNISILTTAATNSLIEYNDFDNLNAVDVNVQGLAASTGTARYNSCRIVTDGQLTWLNTMGAMQLYENYGVNDDAETGKLIGTVSA